MRTGQLRSEEFLEPALRFPHDYALVTSPLKPRPAIVPTSVTICFRYIYCIIGGLVVDMHRSRNQHGIDARVAWMRVPINFV